MKLVADLHVHTIASGHAFSTVLENARAAADKGLELIAITDHGPAMPAAPHNYYFSNMRVLPRRIYGVEVLRGIEANIMDVQGNIDLPERFLKYMDIVLAGFHLDCFTPGSVEDNTRAMVNTMASGKVDIIVHPGNPGFAVDIEIIARTALEHGVVLEINNTSLVGLARKGSRQNCNMLGREVARIGGMVSLGSDAHFAYQVGELAGAARLAAESELKPEQVLNTSLALIKQFLKRRGRNSPVEPSPQF